MAGWTSDDIPDQSGKTVLVTGGNSGLGYQTVLPLARKGARVLLAARDRARGTAALERLGAPAPGPHAEPAQHAPAVPPAGEGSPPPPLAPGPGVALRCTNPPSGASPR